MDLQQQLERDIGHGPALPTPEQRLAAGRAALRRRRLTVGAGAAAVLVAIAAPFALGSGEATRSPEVTDSPSPSPSSEPAPDRWSRAGGFGYDRGGTLHISSEAVVHERRNGVVPGLPSSVALDLTFRGERTWHVTRLVEDGSWVGIESGAGHEPDLYRDFDEFVAKAAFCLRQGVDPLTGPSSLVLDVVDGSPQVAGAGTAIGPVVREDQRGFGFEVGSGGARQFVLLIRSSTDSWRVERVEAPADGAADVASWLRGLGWLPTGEAES